MSLADENDVKNPGAMVREIAEVVNAFPDKAMEAKKRTLLYRTHRTIVKAKTDAL